MAVAAKRRAPAKKAAKKRAPAKKAVKRATAKKAVKRAPARKSVKRARHEGPKKRAPAKKAAKKRAPAKKGPAKRAVRRARPTKKRAPAKKAKAGKKRAPAKKAARGGHRPRSGLRPKAAKRRPSGLRPRRPRARSLRPQGGEAPLSASFPSGTRETGGLRAPGSACRLPTRVGGAPRRRPASRRRRPGPGRAGPARQSQPRRLGPVGAERAGPVGEAEVGPAGRRSTLVPSSRRSGTRVTPSNGASGPSPCARGRSPWATVTQRCPARPRRSTPARTAPLRPCPGSDMTVAPAPRPIAPHRRRHRRRPRAGGRRPPPPVTPWCGRGRMRSASDSAEPSRRLAWSKALTGMRTTSGPRATRQAAPCSVLPARWPSTPRQCTGERGDRS